MSGSVFYNLAHAFRQAATYGYLPAGVCFAAGRVWPPLGILIYPALAFLAWALLRGRVTRLGLFIFWLPYCLASGEQLSPAGLHVGLLAALVLGNLFYLLQTRALMPGGKLFLLPAGFFLFAYASKFLPFLPPAPGDVGAYAARLAELLGPALSLFALVLLVCALAGAVLEQKRGAAVIAAVVFTLLLTVNLLNSPAVQAAAGKLEVLLLLGIGLFLATQLLAPERSKMVAYLRSKQNK